MRAEYDEAVRIFESLLQEVVATKDPEQEATVRDNLATGFAAAGNYLRALEEYRSALDLHRRASRVRSQVYGLLNISETLSRLGRFDEADRALADAKGLGQTTPEISIQTLRIEAAGELRRGRYREAAALSRKVLGAGSSQSVERFLRASLIACAAEGQLGRYREAGVICDDALMRSAARGHLEILREGRLVTAEMYLRSGDRAAAERVLRESAAAAEKSVSPEERCRYFSLSVAVAAGDAKDRLREQLTRELAGLRMNWGEGSYSRWLARADIRGVMALATTGT
jgi:tetratricopeptide (TPR) repeat protein